MIESQQYPVDFPVSALTAEALATLPVRLGVFGDKAPALVHCVQQTAYAEAWRRSENATRKPEERIEPGLIVVDFDLWSDRDVADALLVLLGLLETNDPDFGELIDEWQKTVNLVAILRLRESGDPRNACDYIARTRVNNDPENN